MCGVCGIYNYGSGAPPDRDVVQAMTDSIAHRGPDGEGSYFDGEVGLGHRRLSIIDVTGGKQPLTNEDGSVWITFNGEIYNFKDLVADLEKRGHTFRTRTDTEVIVHGYEEWGDDVVLKLNGIFAFGLWDSRRKRLLVARDHFGVKPMYYADERGRFVFASEVKAILQVPGIDGSFTAEAIDTALRYGFLPAPLTLFGPVKKLAAGHRLVVTPNGAGPQEKYSVADTTLLSGISEEDLARELAHRIETAVERQMMSDVPIGALLSGGVDSTAVVTLMARHSERVRTFTVGLRGSSEIDRVNEVDAARRTAKRLGTQHEDVQVGMTEYMDFLEPSYWHLEEPCTPSALLMYFVCKLARQSVKVVLTGQGADEPFGGYARYVGESYGEMYRRLPRAVTESVVPKLLGASHARLRWRRGAYALAERNPIRRFERIYEVFSPEQRAALFRSDVLPEAGEDVLARWGADIAQMPALDQLLRIDVRCGLADNLLIFGDKMSMAASVESRVPMLDMDLMRFAESIPASVKMRGHKPKRLLKRALARIVPQEVLNGPKLGFEVPLEAWMRDRLGTDMRDLVLRAGGVVDTFMHRDPVEELFRSHRDKRANRWRQIFLLVQLEALRNVFRNSSKVTRAPDTVVLSRVASAS